MSPFSWRVQSGFRSEIALRREGAGRGLCPAGARERRGLGENVWRFFEVFFSIPRETEAPGNKA